MNREPQSYGPEQVMAADPVTLVAMLYDRAIMLLHDAVDAIEAGNIERRWRANSKATEIVVELWQALDMEAGGEIAGNLNRLYEFMVMRLTMVDTENNAQAARDVIGLLEPLRRSWHEIADGEGPNGESQGSSGDPTSLQISLSA